MLPISVFISSLLLRWSIAFVTLIPSFFLFHGNMSSKILDLLNPSHASLSIALLLHVLRTRTRLIMFSSAYNSHHCLDFLSSLPFSGAPPEISGNAYSFFIFTICLTKTQSPSFYLTDYSSKFTKILFFWAKSFSKELSLQLFSIFPLSFLSHWRCYSWTQYGSVNYQP